MTESNLNMLQSKHFRKDEGGRVSWSLRYHTIKLKLLHVLLVRLVIILDFRHYSAPQNFEPLHNLC